MTNYDSVHYRSLAGKGIVITGGASGIGAAMVEAFASQGARIDFLDIDEKAAARFPYKPAYLPVTLLTDGTMWNW